MTTLVDVIRQDHQEVKDLLSAIAADPDAATFDLLALKIGVHESTEQEIVHPLTARAPGGEPIAESRLHEETKGSQALTKLQEMGVTDPDFAAAFDEFRRDVLAHAEREENEEHPKLTESVDAARLEELGEMFRTEESSRIDAST